MYVCMSHNFHKRHRIRKHTGKGSPGAFLFNFFLPCEGGGTSGSLDRVQTCMYVCMFELPVCMFEALKYVCICVCMFEALKRVCLKPSSVYECMSNFTKKLRVQKHTGKCSPGAFLFTFLVLCEGGGYFREALKHVCMYV